MRRLGRLLARSALLMLVTTAVAGWPGKREQYEPVEIPQDISQGYSLVLLKPLVVPSGSKAVLLQGGELVEEHGIRADAPYCRLELAEPARTKLTLPPQDFLVTNVTYDDRAHGHAGGGNSTTYLSLHAAKSGGTSRMACRWPDSSARPDFLTPEEVAAALSGYFSIEPPD
jgi:hypothetical protein